MKATMKDQEQKMASAREKCGLDGNKDCISKNASPIGFSEDVHIVNNCHCKGIFSFIQPKN